MLHLYPDPELFGENLDELPEVHPSVRDVVEYGLGAVSLEFHVADFHLKPQFCGYLPGAYHSLLLAGYGYLPVLYVEGSGLAVYLPEFGRRGIHALAGHLAHHDRPLEGYDSEVVAVLGLDYHHIPGAYALLGVIAVEALPGVLEADFIYVRELVLVHTFQPVCVHELAAARPVGAGQFVVYVA